MAHLDTSNRRIDLQVVYLGPAQSGTSTILRFLHAACAPTVRGDLVAVEHGGGQGIVGEYVPFDLPRWGELAVRAHVYATGAVEGGLEGQAPLLAGADAVVFVADARRSARARNLCAWRHLDALLVGLEEGKGPCPLLVAANHCDAADALPAEAVLATLASAVPARHVLAAFDTCATSGSNVTAGFEQALEAAAERALPPQPPEHSEGVRQAFRLAFSRRFRGASARVSAAPGTPRRVAAALGSGPRPPAAPPLSLEISRALARRELDVRRFQRERVLGGLMLEVGQMCLTATGIESLLRRVLGSLTVNLDAVMGWIAHPDAEAGHTIYDPIGVSREGAAFGAAAARLSLGLADGAVVPVGAETETPLPGDAAGCRGLFAPFPAGAGRRGWLLLVGPPEKGLPEDAASVLPTAGAFVGLTLARLSALQRLRESHAALEDRVGLRTQEIRQEKALLEERVRERTRELEQAKRAIVEAERRLLDRERAEGVHRLAAGLAHELNNPIGAALANLDFVLEGLQRLAEALPEEARGEARDVLEAARDTRRDLQRVSASIGALFGQATSMRRAAVRSPLTTAVRSALRSYGKAMPRAPLPTLEVLQDVSCGIPPAECSRWLFRALTTLAQLQVPIVALEVDRRPEGPCVRLRLSTEAQAARAHLASLAEELVRGGARLTAVEGSDGPALDLVLPPAVGEALPSDAGANALSELRR